jgi:FMN-dependent dehydrogenase/Phage integrase family
MSFHRWIKRSMSWISSLPHAKHCPPAHFGHLATGVDDDGTVRANREGYSRLQIRSRRLVSVETIDMSVHLFGTTWSSPIVISPARPHKAQGVDDWVFASPAARGRRPYWGQCLMWTIIRPAAAKAGITQHIGWQTFRHTYSSLLRANKTDIKVTQELLRHASSRVTLDTYTQAITAQKRRAQSSVIRLRRRLQQPLVEIALLGCVPILCLLETV